MYKRGTVLPLPQGYRTVLGPSMSPNNIPFSVLAVVSLELLAT